MKNSIYVFLIGLTLQSCLNYEFSNPYENSSPETPVLIQPINNATDVSTFPTLTWSKISIASSYLLQVSTDNSFSNNIINQNVGNVTSKQIAGLNTSTQYYWQVRAINDYGTSKFSNVWSFTTTGTTSSFICGAPITYSGKIYNTVQVGNQCWMKENLDIGIMISGSQDQSNNGTNEKYCYKDDPNNCSLYGGLYQWNEAMGYSNLSGAKGICLPGWHIPTYGEYTSLITYVNRDGNALKMLNIGNGSGLGTNTSGFSSLLTGYYASNNNFTGVGLYSVYWSSSLENSLYPITLDLYGFNSLVGVTSFDKAYGMSVRCLKDY